jgi:outer membrane lipopolysaccharide assembly protein LptE/RlpB
MRIFCHPALLSVSIFSLATLFLACGYHVRSSAPIVLPENICSLYVEKVTNPSTESWLEPYLRSSLRDEFTRRGQIQWVDKHQAKGILEILISTWRSSTLLEDADDQTVKSEALMRFKARIYRHKDHTLLWESNLIEVRESYSSGMYERGGQKAEHRVIDLGMERLADQLSQNF